jgi:hypothetical protein
VKKDQRRAEPAKLSQVSRQAVMAAVDGKQAKAELHLVKLLNQYCSRNMSTGSINDESDVVPSSLLPSTIRQERDFDVLVPLGIEAEC